MKRGYKLIAMLVLAASSAFGYGGYDIFSGTNSVDSGGAVLYPPSGFVQRLDAYPALTGEPDFNDKVGVLTNATAGGMPCLTFNGTDQYFYYDTGSTASGYFGACTMSAWVNHSSIIGTRVIWSHGDSSYRVYNSGGELRINSSSTGANIFTVGAWLFIEVDFDVNGNGVSARANGATVWSGLAPAGATSGDSRFAVGCRLLGTPAVFMSGSIAQVNVCDDAIFPLCEKSGTTVFDVTDNGNDGTINPGTGDLETMWTSNTQSKVNYFGQYGGRKVILGNGTDYAQINSSESLFNFGADDFEIEIDTDLEVSPTSTKTLVSKYTVNDIESCWSVVRVSGGDLVLRTSSNGTGFTVSTVAAVDVPGGWKTIKAAKSGTAVVWTFDGVVATSTGSAVATLFTSAAPVLIGAEVDVLSPFAVLRQATKGISRVKVTTTGGYAEFFAGNAYDTVLPNSGTLGENATATADMIQYVPSLLDGTACADGEPIENTVSVAHNGGPYSILQTDTNLLSNAFWATGGTNFNTITYSNLINHASGADDVWTKTKDINSVCHITDITTYPDSYEWTPGAYTIASLYYGMGACGSFTAAIPYPVVSGGIGPGGTWYTYDGIHIYLVIP